MSSSSNSDPNSATGPAGVRNSSNKTSWSSNNSHNPPRTRSAAHELIAEKWQQRRLATHKNKRQPQQQQNSGDEKVEQRRPKASSTTSAAWLGEEALRRSDDDKGAGAGTVADDAKTSTPVASAPQLSLEQQLTPSAPSSSSSHSVAHHPMSFCYLMKKTWEQAWRDVPWNNKKGERSAMVDAPAAHPNATDDFFTATASATATTTTKKGTAGKSRRDYFPSVLSIFQRNALVRQVKTLQGQKGNTASSSAGGEGWSSSSSMRRRQDAARIVESQVLSVLPSGYDWNRAVRETAAKRSRAFWLLDLSTIIRTTVDWKHRYCSGGGSSGNSSSRKGGRVQFVYDLHHSSNADVILLQVLLQSGIVSLATSSKWDLERARNAVQKAAGYSSSSSSSSLGGDKHDPCIFDCTSVTGKPDGYIREWIRQSSSSSSNSGAASKAGPLVVDGPEEVRRVCSSVDRILRRRRRQLEVTGGGGGNGNLSIANARDCRVDFILRLPGLDPDEWRSILQSTARALAEHSCRLVGISFDLSFPEAASDTDQQSCHLEAIESLLDYLAEFDVVEKDLRIDLTGVPLVAASTNTAGRNVATASSNEQEFSEAVVSWWNRLLHQRQDVSQITVDATRLLVEPAGALCTRIIGVRRQEGACRKDGIDGAESTRREAADVQRRHYYIDDGCYGSLYSNNRGDDSSLCPLPLFSQQGRDSQFDIVKGKQGPTECINTFDGKTQLYRTTIWGPTCDGLDRVSFLRLCVSVR